MLLPMFAWVYLHISNLRTDKLSNFVGKIYYNCMGKPYS